MSIGLDAAEAVLKPADTRDGAPLRGDQGEAPARLPEASQTEVHNAGNFAYVWQLFGYTIRDRSGATMGPVARVWTDLASGELKFVGLTTGRLRRQTHVIPAGNVRIDDLDRSMNVPYRAVAIRRAPHHNSDVSPKSDQERKVYSHYGNS